MDEAIAADTQARGAALPAALAEPVAPVRRGWVTLLFLANIGLWLGIYAPIQVLLPEQVQSLHDHITKSNVVPSGTDAVLLSVVMGVGAIAGLIANPIVGALSDRTTSARGRRHPWTLGCAVVAALGLLVVAAAPAVPVMAVGWFIAELGLGGMLATLTAALPDRVPVSQRGTIGALIGISQMLGTVLGALLVTVIITRLSAGYVACAIIVVGLAAAFTLRTTDHALPAEYKPDHPVSTALRRLWVSPRAYPDFAWGWATHFLINLGNDLGTLYLLYFLSRGAHYHDPQTGLLILMALYAVALLAAGSVLGTMSDRSGRRKPFVIASATAMALAAALLAVSPTWSMALVAAPLLGAGFGTYWAAGPALLTQVLPAAVDRGKDVGLINIAYNLPLVVAPLAAGVVLGLMNSYPALFALAGIVTILAAWTVSRVRSVG
ncbi:MAG TPA: MFS transporter [Trebonia sp.]|nr:MFS transporter [Trebonia sp.]